MAGNCDPSNLAESPNLQQCLHELQTKLDRCRGNIISFNIHDKDPGLREAVTELSFECQKIGEKLDSFVELLCRIKVCVFNTYQRSYTQCHTLVLHQLIVIIFL